MIRYNLSIPTAYCQVNYSRMLQHGHNANTKQNPSTNPEP